MKANIIGLGSRSGVAQTTHSDTAKKKAKEVSFQLDKKAQAQQDQVQHAPAQQEMVNGSQPIGEYEAEPSYGHAPCIDPDKAFGCGCATGFAAGLAGGIQFIVFLAKHLDTSGTVILGSYVAGTGSTASGLFCADNMSKLAECCDYPVLDKIRILDLTGERINIDLLANSRRASLRPGIEKKDALEVIKTRILQRLPGSMFLQGKCNPEDYILCDGAGNQIETLDQLVQAKKFGIKKEPR